MRVEAPVWLLAVICLLSYENVDGFLAARHPTRFSNNVARTNFSSQNNNNGFSTALAQLDSVSGPNSSSHGFASMGVDGGEAPSMEVLISGLPSLSDVYDRLDSLQHGLQEKDEVFQETIKQLDAESDKTINSMKEWDAYFKSKEQSQSKEVEQLREMFLTNEKTSTEKIHWLGEQLHKLKFTAHQQQLAASQAAQADRTKLKTRLDELQAELQRQIQAKEEESSKGKLLLEKRTELERELSTVKKALLDTVDDLQNRVRLEQEARVRELQEAKSQLSREQEAANLRLAALAEKAIKDEEALMNDLKVKEEQFGLEIQQLRESSQKTEKELAESIETIGSELQAEKEQSMKKQGELLAAINAKESELQNQVAETAAHKSTADALRQKRAEIEQEASTLRRQYDNSVSEWQSRFKSLEEALVNEQKAATELIKQKEQETQMQVASALNQADSYKTALENGLKAKDAQHTQIVQELKDASASAQQKLTESLRAMGGEMNRVKSEAEQRLRIEQETSQKNQEMLLAKLHAKEKELKEQVALTIEAENQASTSWQRRMELESELSALKHKYDTTVAEWESRYQSLQEVRLNEQMAAESLLASKEAEAKKELASARNEVESHRAALESGLKAKDTHYGGMIQDIRESSKKKENELVSTLNGVSNELQNHKLESHKMLMSEKETFVHKEKELLEQIKAKEAELEDQMVNFATIGQMSARQQELEADLASLKQRHDSTVSEWEQRYRFLEKEREKEQRRAQSLLEQTEAEARAKVAAATRDAEKRKVALEQGLQNRDNQYKAMIEKLRDSSGKKQRVMSESLLKINMELQQHKHKSHQELTDARKTAEARAREIKKKEKEIQTTQQMISVAQKENDAQRTRVNELEEELSGMKQQLASMVEKHESQLQTMQEAQREEQKAAESLLARKEAEAYEMIAAARKEAEQSNGALKNGLSAKDAEYGDRIKELRDTWKSKEKEHIERLQETMHAHEQQRLAAHNKLMAEKEAASKKESELRAKIAEKDRELHEQATLTTVQGSRANEFLQRRAMLEKKVTELERQLETVTAEWELRYKSAQETLFEEQRAAQAKLLEKEAEAQELLQAAEWKANANEVALESTLKEKNDQHAHFSKAIADLQEVVNEKEMELREIREMHNLKLQQLKHDSNKVVIAEQAGAIFKQKGLLSKVEEKEEEIRAREALLALEKAKSKEIWESRIVLDGELTALKKKHAEAILEWETRYESLQGTLREEQRAAAEELSRSEAEARKQIDAAVAEAKARKAELDEALKTKGAEHEAELQNLRNLSERKEKELSEKITAITKDFHEYKFDAKKRLTVLGEEATAEGRKQAEEAAEEGYRLAERVRYDLTKQLVKKEVELLRQKAELKQKDAQIAALRGGKNFDDDDSESPSSRNLTSMKERVSNILRPRGRLLTRER